MSVSKKKSSQEKEDKKKSKNLFELIAEYIQALLGAILLAIVIRGFFFEPFKIPSESMVPTLLVGDHIFVKRYAYGLRIPFTKKWIAEFEDPKRGDVVVFSFPEDESIDFIKRVVGLPGDKVTFKNGEVFINDQKVEWQNVELTTKAKDNPCHINMTEASETMVPDDLEPYPYYQRYTNFQPKLETLPNGQKHYIQRSKVLPMENNDEFIVPERHFFVMGDNRDHSQDSRFWGFVPRENLKGKAEVIWLSINHEDIRCANDLGVLSIRFDRFGREII